MWGIIRFNQQENKMNRIAVGTWVEFLKDYQGAKAQDQCKVQCNIQGGLYVVNCKGEEIYSLRLLIDSGVIEIMKGGKNNYNTDISTLAWQHNRSALVHLMLLDGYKYIMCEVAEEDKQYFKDETPRFIVESMGDGGFFIDVRGNMWQSAQPINNDGTEMTYEDYIKLKQLQELDNVK